MRRPFVRTLSRRLAPWAVPVLLVAIWQLSANLGWLSTRVLPAPLDVTRAAVHLYQTGDLMQYIAVSTRRAAAGGADVLTVRATVDPAPEEARRTAVEQSSEETRETNG